MFKFLSNERILSTIDPAKILMYKGLTGTLYYYKKIVVTNKRIIISFNWFGFENFVGAMSCFYNKKDYDKHKSFGDSLILYSELGKGWFLGKFLKIRIKQYGLRMNIKIYDEKDLMIKKIIDKYSK